MKHNKLHFYVIFLAAAIGLGVVNSSQGMGLRSFVALPVEKGGAVVRLAFEHAGEINRNRLITSMAYGFNAKQTLLLGLPYRLSPAGAQRQGDVSALYRHIIWQVDSLSGTNRLGWLGGVIVPTTANRDGAAQVGFVLTHFKHRHEIDVDVLYQVGAGKRVDSGRYDLSWQYRLSPVERPDWGIATEVNGVL